jgi:hypothetical protein
MYTVNMENTYVFGARTLMQTVVNFSLLKHPPKVSFVKVGDYIRMFEFKGRGQTIMRTLRRFRKAKRPIRYLPDNDQVAIHTACKICLTNQPCVAIQPCNHVGICNGCCLKLFNCAFTSQTSFFLIADGSKCPFCRTPVQAISYMYFV